MMSRDGQVCRNASGSDCLVPTMVTLGYLIDHGDRNRAFLMESQHPRLTESEVTIERVIFDCGGERLVGDLHLPTGSGPHPGTIVGGPMTSVKEQVTGTYAAALARHGIAALAIDHRHYGESGGAPRQYEYYPHKIADLLAATDALKSHTAIDANCIAATGVCLGSGYVAHAIGERADIKGFAAVAGYYRDVPALKAADAKGFASKVAQGRAARELYETTGKVEMIPAVALDQDAAMTIQSTYDYYAGRATHPNYVNGFAVMSREHFLQFDVQTAATGITMPFLMAHSPNALNPAWARAFYARVPGPKQAIEITARDQTDIYDNPVIVQSVSSAVAKFFNARFS